MTQHVPHRDWFTSKFNRAGKMSAPSKSSEKYYEMIENSSLDFTATMACKTVPQHNWPNNQNRKTVYQTIVKVSLSFSTPSYFQVLLLLLLNTKLFNSGILLSKNSLLLRIRSDVQSSSCRTQKADGIQHITRWKTYNLNQLIPSKAEHYKQCFKLVSACIKI